jgi:hypothetical protein
MVTDLEVMKLAEHWGAKVTRKNKNHPSPVLPSKRLELIHRADIEGSQKGIIDD